MCGRYSLFADEDPEIKRIAAAALLLDPSVKTGEIFPANTAPVLLETGGRIEVGAFGWGFPGWKGKGAVINARGETAAEKRMFQAALHARRCVVPTTGFYEWDAEKRKQLFRLPGSRAVYLAGLYGAFAGENRYVILTTAANASVAEIHHRMPVVLERGRIEAWLTDETAAALLLRETPPALEHAPA